MCWEYHPFVVAWVSWDSVALQLEPGLHQVERVHQQNLHTSCDQEGKGKEEQEWQSKSTAGDTIGTIIENKNVFVLHSDNTPTTLPQHSDNTLTCVKRDKL